MGERIRELRLAIGLTQAELAASCAVTVQAVSGWEAGGGGPHRDMLPRIADALGVSIDDLFRRAAVPSQGGPQHLPGSPS